MVKYSYAIKVAIFIATFTIVLIIIAPTVLSHNIIARVNGEPIYLYQIKDMEIAAKELNEFVSTDVILEQAIRDILIYHEAGKLSIDITEEKLNNKIEAIKNAPPAFYNALIEKYGTENEYKKTLDITVYLWLCKLIS